MPNPWLNRRFSLPVLQNALSVGGGGGGGIVHRCMWFPRKSSVGPYNILQVHSGQILHMTRKKNSSDITQIHFESDIAEAFSEAHN